MNISEIRQQYPQYDDMSDTALADALYSKDYSDMDRGEFDQAIGFESRGSVLDPISQGLTFGFADELAAGGAAAVGTVLPESMGGFAKGTKFTDAYTGIRDDLRGDASAYAEANPVTSPAAEFASGLLTGGAGAARTMGSSLFKAGMNLAPKTTRLAALSGTSALGGGLYGAGVGEGLEDTIDKSETGAAIGAVAGPVFGKVADKITSAVTRRSVDKAVARAVPEVDDLTQKAGQLYKQADNLGIQTTPDAIQDLSSQMATKMKGEGYHPRLHPKVSVVLDEIEALSEKGATLTDIQNLRKMAGSAAGSIEAPERRLGMMVIDKVDDFIDGLSPNNTVSGNAEQAGVLLKEARGLWSKTRKHETLTEALTKAQSQASGLENGIRIQLRHILNNKKRRRGFNAAEISEMEKIVRGDKTGNILRLLGRFAPGEGAAHNMLGAVVGAGAGGMAAGIPGAIGVPLGGMAARGTSSARTQRGMQGLLGQTLTGGQRDTGAIVSRLMREGMSLRDATAMAASMQSQGLLDQSR